MASSLATRCTACGTVFRVVPDQLRVSEGWVRCGRCSEVFNAAEHLLDMPAGAQLQPQDLRAQPATAPPPQPSAWDEPSSYPGDHADFDAERSPQPSVDRHSAPDDLPPDERSFQGRDEPAFAAQFAEEADADVDRHGAPDDDPAFAATRLPPPSEMSADTLQFDAGDSAVDISAAGSNAADLDDLRATRADAVDDAGTGTGSLVDTTPSFLRRAERAQRWRQPRVRIALWSLVLLAGLGLAAQVVFTYRDLAAARFTALRPALELACGWLACTVGDAHAIDSLVVESSGLVRVEKSSVYKFSVALRNRAAIAVAVPAVEVALTDAQGKLLARRVLRATELGASQTALAAGRDLALQATLQAATDPVAGYTIELFYP